VLAVPVAPPDVEDRFRGDADQVIAVQTPEMFYASGQFYRDFSQTTDSEVVDLLVRASGAEPPAPTGATGGDPPLRSEDVEIPAGPVSLAGHLEIPEDPLGIVVFAHGSGSSRHSSRNRYVATALNEAAIGTLLFDLLTEDEEHDRANVFDIELLARRLGDATRWLRSQPGASGLAVGYFGASTGAAAALRAAAELGEPVAAVVSRGGRPDLAGSSLASVVAPTRLIVGGRDTVVLDLNRKAQQQLRCENDLVVVPGATHLFEEPGALALAAGHAREWFTRHLAPAGGGCRDGDLLP
jgi:putative phosphoribosyl transferase